MKPERGTGRQIAAPNALASRLEVSTTSGGGRVDRELARDLEPLDVGQADVEQDEVGPEVARRSEAGRAVARLADHGEPVRLEQGARLDPEAGVVVDDENGVHASDRGMPTAGRATGLTRHRDRATRSECGRGAGSRRRAG